MSAALLMPATLLAYFFLLLFVSHRATRSGAKGNDAFFRAGRQSHWAMVAFGMIGASISGVSFISVPGWAKTTGMTYLQMCIGFVAGYLAVAFVLLPVYYRLSLTSIYTYLGLRFGKAAHRTGSMFFVLSKLCGSAARLYLVCVVIEQFAVRPWLGEQGTDSAAGILSFSAVALCVLLLIWLYTRRGGIQTVVRTDALQTLCMLLALLGVTVAVATRLNLSPSGVVRTISESGMCRVWEWDWRSPQAFWRQFLSGMFIVIVMTGLDQDMMQKNLTCRSLREAQKDMCSYGLAFLPVNALFLGLGILLYTFAARQTPPVTATGDALLPALVADGLLGAWVVAPFTIGIVAAAFSSADSALTALTTTVCIDILGIERRKESLEQNKQGLERAELISNHQSLDSTRQKQILPQREQDLSQQGQTSEHPSQAPSHKRQGAKPREWAPERAAAVRRRVHIGMAATFFLCIVAFRVAGSQNALNTVYVLASYTYGPLLGLFAYGLYTRGVPRGRLVPLVCVAAPLLCGWLDYAAPRLWGYTFGYELLLLNGALTFLGLALASAGQEKLPARAPAADAPAQPLFTAFSKKRGRQRQGRK